MGPSCNGTANLQGAAWAASKSCSALRGAPVFLLRGGIVLHLLFPDALHHDPEEPDRPHDRRLLLREVAARLGRRRALLQLLVGHLLRHGRDDWHLDAPLVLQPGPLWPPAG